MKGRGNSWHHTSGGVWTAPQTRQGGRKGGGLQTKAQMEGVSGWVGGTKCWWGGGSLSSLPSWTTERPRQSPDVTHCTQPSQLPDFLSPLAWCHRPAGDVTSTPLRPLRLPPLSTWLQSVASHCDRGQSAEHVPNTGRKTTMQERTIHTQVIYIYYVVNINHIHEVMKAKQGLEILITTAQPTVWCHNTVCLLCCFMKFTFSTI